MNRRVVITGMGVVSPIGNNVEEFYKSLRNSTSGIKKIDELEEIGLNCTVGGLCDVSNEFIKSRFFQLNIPIISRSTLLLVQACNEAIENAGLKDFIETPDFKETDIIIGSTTGPADIWSNFIIPFTDQKKHLRLGSYAFEQIINSSPAAMLSGILGTNGRVISNSLACASSTESIIDAANSIIHSNKNCVIAGGVESYSKYYWALMDAMKITNSKFNHAPESASRPLSINAKGFIPAEGSGVVILEELEHAKLRKATIYAEIIGGHINSGGQKDGGTMSCSNQNQLRECIKKTILNAGIKSSEINLISGHLTGTKADLIEIEAWKCALDLPFENFPLINAPKSLIGHTLGACGAIETIASIVQIRNNFIHASINCEDINPKVMEFIPLQKVVRNIKENNNLNYIAKANFGFGDVNACLILKSFHE